MGRGGFDAHDDKDGQTSARDSWISDQEAKDKAMTDEALTREQLRERMNLTIAGFMLLNWSLVLRKNTQEELCSAILALLPSAQGKDGGAVDQVWDALRLRCCSSGLEAKRVVMVSRDDLAHALKVAHMKDSN